MFDQSYKERNYDSLKKFDTALRAMGWLKNGFVLSFYCLRYHQIYQEDILNFKDSDRESLISYFENNSDNGKSRTGLKLDDNFFYR